MGLSGSSAIVISTFSALMSYYQVTLQDLCLSKSEFAQVILDVEKEELGINAGLQDRVVQVFGGLVHMDFSQLQTIENSKSGIKVGSYTSLDSSLLPPLYLAYNMVAGGDSGQVHSTVKERWLRRDPELVEGMTCLGLLADKAKDCLQQNQLNLLPDLMDQNIQWRRKLYGDAVVGEVNIQAIEIANTHGLAAKFSGSGGALVCLRRDDPSSW